MTLNLVLQSPIQAWSPCRRRRAPTRAAAGETVTFTVDGEDEQAACEAMRAFCAESL